MTEPTQMTDLEMTKLCAAAMGLDVTGTPPNGHLEPLGSATWLLHSRKSYDPLHDDAQAMALVKRFNLSVEAPCCATGLWHANQGNNHTIIVGPNGRDIAADSDNLNRAIVECVARMQEKSPPDVSVSVQDEAQDK